MSGSYTALAACYDALMADVDYEGWADFYEAVFRKYGNGMPKLVLDLGCGTGHLTSILAARGYEMLGIDRSPEMLSHAAARAERAGQNILFSEQDMCSFDLYGTVDAVVCSLDCVNYLTKPAELNACLARVHTFLAPGGLFLFDVNTPWKFEHEFGDNSYILEEDGLFLGWQNFYTKSTGLCRFYLTFFRETNDGLWERVEEEQRERAYSDAVLCKYLAENGFSVLDTVSGFDFSPAGKTDERHFFLCRRETKDTK